MRHSTAIIVVTALFAFGAGTAFGQTGVTLPTSSTFTASDAGVKAHTNIQVKASPGAFNGAHQVYGPPFPGYFYEDPASLACIYDLIEAQGNNCNPNVVSRNPNGGSNAIAIVDAYDDPNATTDLQQFSAQFGVRAPDHFSVVYAPAGGLTPGSCSGPASAPPQDPTGGWELEESLDIEYSHSMAPQAKLYLVEAQSDYLGDLFCAVTVASNLVKAAGGGEVSMSWGSAEFPQETLLDSIFTTPGVVYFASAGDTPGASWPSASPNAISVGGTSISRDPVTGNFVTEINWQDAGSGPSSYEPRPAFQNGVRNIVGNYRGTPDMALDANPYTGVWVLDDFLPPAGCGAQCWWIVGGTSVSSPTLAGIVNAADNLLNSSNAELNLLYGAPGSDFNNIKVGSCCPYMGYTASAQWDFCTGLGSPNGYISQRGNSNQFR